MKTEYDIKKLKDNLRSLWLDSGLTQKELAAEIGINEKTLNNILNPDSVNPKGELIYPDLKTLIKLCKKFDCDIDYLFGILDYSQHDNKFICQNVGLSEQTIKSLQAASHSKKQIIEWILTKSPLLDHIEQYIEINTEADRSVLDPELPDNIKISGIDITKEVLKQAILNLIRSDLDLADILLTLNFDDVIGSHETNIKHRPC